MAKRFLRPWIIVLTLIGFALLVMPETALGQAALPHVFIGEAGAVTEGLNNEPVKSGTITAWIDDKPVVSAIIDNGAYQLLVEQPSGYSFSGKFVAFTVDGNPTDSKAIWITGGADILPLKVITAAIPATVVPPAQVATVVPASAAAEKFRENPQTRLRPVEDVITADQDGIIEAFMFNPSVNDVSLSVDLVLTVPSGIHVYGQGFACSGTGAGTCAGYFTILPGQSKTVVINVKSEKMGSHQVHLSGYWWPGDNKDMRQPISLTHPFEVTSVSKDLTAPTEVPESQPSGANGSKGNDGGCGISPGGSIPIGSMSLFLGVGLMGFRGMFRGLF
jgi:hypothetical protein